jgi:hypothetical protein
MKLRVERQRPTLPSVRPRFESVTSRRVVDIAHNLQQRTAELASVSLGYPGLERRQERAGDGR